MERERDYLEVLGEMEGFFSIDWESDSLVLGVECGEVPMYGSLFNQDAELPVKAVKYSKGIDGSSEIIKFEEDGFVSFIKRLLDEDLLSIAIFLRHDEKQYFMIINQDLADFKRPEATKLVYGDSELKEKFDRIFGLNQKA